MKKLLLFIFALSSFAAQAQLALSGNFVAEGTNLGCAYNPQYLQTVTAEVVTSGPMSYGRIVTVDIETAPTSPHKFDCKANYLGTISSDGAGNYTGGLSFQSCSCVPAQFDQACRNFIDAFYGEPANQPLEILETANGFSLRQLREAPRSPRWPCGDKYPTYMFVRQ